MDANLVNIVIVETTIKFLVTGILILAGVRLILGRQVPTGMPVGFQVLLWVFCLLSIPAVVSALIFSRYDRFLIPNILEPISWGYVVGILLSWSFAAYWRNWRPSAVPQGPSLRTVILGVLSSILVSTVTFFVIYSLKKEEFRARWGTTYPASHEVIPPSFLDRI